MADYNSRPYSLKVSRGNIGVVSLPAQPRSPRFSNARVSSLIYTRRRNQRCRIFVNSKGWHSSSFRYSFLNSKTYFSQAFRSSQVIRCFRNSDYSLSDAFGLNARQNNDTLIIKKSDFTRFGLPDNATWKVTDLISALLLQGESKFKSNRRIRIRFYRTIHIIQKDKAYEKKSYIIISYSIAPREKFPSPRSFLN
jgi:hypothetical protein